MSKGGEIHGDRWKLDFWWLSCNSVYRYRIYITEIYLMLLTNVTSI